MHTLIFILTLYLTIIVAEASFMFFNKEKFTKETIKKLVLWPLTCVQAVLDFFTLGGFKNFISAQDKRDLLAHLLGFQICTFLFSLISLFNTAVFGTVLSFWCIGFSIFTIVSIYLINRSSS